MTEDVEQRCKLSAAEVRWECPKELLRFKSTRDVPVDERFFGQEEAIEALRYGLDTRNHGHNIFVRGISGLGRTALVHRMVEEYQPKCAPVPDRCYVHNFRSPEQVRLITLPTAEGRVFRHDMERFADFIEKELNLYLSSDRIKSRQRLLEEKAHEEMRRIGKPLEEELSKQGLAMMPMQVGSNMVPAIVPIIDGNAISFDKAQKLRVEGKISDKDFNDLMEKISVYEKKMADIGQEVIDAQIRHRDAVIELMKSEAESTIAARLKPIGNKWQGKDVEIFLHEVSEDILEHRLLDLGNIKRFTRNYRVNLILGREADSKGPVIVEVNPTVNNLFGTIEREFSTSDMMVRSDHLMIKPGSLLLADGGFLILDAQDILTEPGAWSALLRTLKTSRYELTHMDFYGMWAAPQLKLEPIPIDVKIILIGDPRIFYMLDAYEPRFNHLFKILADFGDTLSRDEQGLNAYSAVIARLVRSEGLIDTDSNAVARLVEHGARICGERKRLTSRFSRIADICREASYLANKDDRDMVTAEDVTRAIQQSKKRANLPARKFCRMIADQTLKLDVEGQTIGQVNGLAVTQAGPLTFGFPTRITASIGPGSSGAINIERESKLSGSVHTKGFLILSGLMRHLIKLDNPLAFSASIAFEQTYGGIDGDSASAAEFCCLLSALTEIPIKQYLAMTGAVDQKGNILPVGAVTEKIEGFYDACKELQLSGNQGVLIPRSNAEELMLREDLVKSIEAGEFSVYAVSTIHEALTVLTGVEAGERGKDGYESASLLGLAEMKARKYWESARQGMQPPWTNPLERTS